MVGPACPLVEFSTISGARVARPAPGYPRSVNTPEPDRPDGDAHPTTDPERALDQAEERTLDDDLRPSGRVDERTDDGTGSAFDIDLDPDDQGSADAGAEQSG